MLVALVPLVASLVPLPCQLQPAASLVVAQRRSPAPLLLASAAQATFELPAPLAPVAPVAALWAIHNALVRTLPRLGIRFPATVVGMLGGFVLLCLLPRNVAQHAEDFFAPGCRLLRDWLAAIFAPGFIALPLVMPPVSATDLASFLLLCVAGFLVTTATNAAIALSLAPPREAVDFEQRELGSPDAGPPPSPPNPFPVTQQAALAGVALVGAGLHLAFHDALSLCACLLATTLGSFSLAMTRCSPSVKLWMHPFLSCSLATLGACGALGAASSAGGAAILAAYAAPGGAGHLLSQLMGPTVLSFAFQLYTYRVQLRRRGVQIVGTALLGSLAGMLTSAAAARAVGLNPALRLALLSRSTISALAIEMGAIFGVQPPALGLLAAFFTGLLAFPFGKALLGLLRVDDPAARGLALAGAAHGGGLLALADEPKAFPFAALGMNLFGACAVCLASVPPVARLLRRVAGV